MLKFLNENVICFLVLDWTGFLVHVFWFMFFL